MTYQKPKETKVVIGIQARSTSTRLPGKAFAMLGDKPVLQHMIDTAKETCTYLNKFRKKTNVVTSFYVLCPHGDPIKAAFESVCNIIEGPEHDVLTRYQILADQTAPDYIVRLTADCPLIPSYLIMKHIKAAVANHYDYISNVHESLRTQLDGFDVEVFSLAMLNFAFVMAKADSDREHVTTLMRSNPPRHAKIGHVIGYLPLQNLKLSIDTDQDLERVREHYGRIQDAIKTARALHGDDCVHRF